MNAKCVKKVEVFLKRVKKNKVQTKAGPLIEVRVTVSGAADR